MSSPTSADAQASKPPPGVLLVSHGFQKTYERGFCNGLTDAGCDFVLVSSDQTDYAGLRPGTATLNLRGSQQPDRARWHKMANLLRYHLRLMAHVAKHRPKVVHVIGLLEPPWLCGIVEGLWFRIWAGRYVLTVHDIRRHDDDSAWISLLHSMSFRIAAIAVAHTVRQREQLIGDYGVDPGRCIVMEHGLEPFDPPLEMPLPRPNADPLRLLVFGIVMRYKGIDLLLQALLDFDAPFELRIVGRSFDASLTQDLEAQIAAHTYAASISWENRFIAESEIAALFADADLLVLPYRHIDQSGVLFQALRYGLPVVATRVGAFDAYVVPEVGECCRPEDPSDLLAALLRVRGRYKSMDRRRIREIGQRYEWQRTVAALQPAYGVGKAPVQPAPSRQ